MALCCPNFPGRFWLVQRKLCQKCSECPTAHYATLYCILGGTLKSVLNYNSFMHNFCLSNFSVDFQDNLYKHHLKSICKLLVNGNTRLFNFYQFFHLPYPKVVQGWGFVVDSCCHPWNLVLELIYPICCLNKIQEFLGIPDECAMKPCKGKTF